MKRWSICGSLWQFMFDFTGVSFDFLKTSLNAFFFFCHFVTLCCFFGGYF